MAWFGPSQIGRSSLAGDRSSDQLDQLAQQVAQRLGGGIPGLSGGRPAARTLQSLGYTGLGPIFYPGQGSPVSLSLFETSGTGVPESITAALATGTARSSSIQPLGSPAQVTPQFQSLPSAPSADLSMLTPQSAGPDIEFGFTDVQGGEGGLGAGTIADAANAGAGLIDLLGPSLTGPSQQSPAQAQTDAFQLQRRGERDYTNLTGSPSGIPQFDLGNLTSAPSGSGALTGQPPTPAAIGQGVQSALDRARQLNMVQQYGQAGNILTPQQEAIQALLGAGLNSDEIANLIGFGSEARALGELGINTDLPPGGEITGIDQQILSQSGITPSALDSFLKGGVFEGGLRGLFEQGQGGLGGNLGVLSGAQAGVQGITGLMGVIQGIQRGDIPQTAGSALSAGQSAALLLNYPQLASALGIAASPLAIYNAVQDPSIQNVLGAALTTYSTLSTIAPSYFTPLSTLAGKGLTAIAPQLAASLGIGAGAAGGAAISSALASGAVTAADLAALGLTGAEIATTAGAEAGTAAATGSTAALGPLAMIIGPYIVGQAIDMVAQMQEAESLEKAMARFKGLSSSIPGHVAALQRAPDLLQQLQQPGTTPQQAAEIFAQLQQIQTQFDQTGMEDFLQHGQTSVTGGGDLGSGALVPFEQGPEIFQALSPYLDALNYGRLIAQDMATRGGITVPGALTPENYAMALGGPSFTQALRPGITGRGQVADYLGIQQSPTGGGFNPAADLGGYNVQQAELEYQQAKAAYEQNPWMFSGPPTPPPSMAPAGPELLAMAGLPPGTQATAADVSRYLSAGGAGRAIADQYQQTNYGLTNMPLFRQAHALQPGQYEQGLRELLGQYGGSPNPYFTAAPQIAEARAQALGQQEAAFSDFTRQLQEYLNTQAAGSLTGIPGLSASAGPALGTDFNQTFAAMTPAQRASLGHVGLTDEMLRELGWLVGPTQPAIA